MILMSSVQYLGRFYALGEAHIPTTKKTNEEKQNNDKNKETNEIEALTKTGDALSRGTKKKKNYDKNKDNNKTEALTKTGDALSRGTKKKKNDDKNKDNNKTETLTKTGDALSICEDCGELKAPTFPLNMAFSASVASAVVK